MVNEKRLIDANALYFAQRYARADPDSDRLTPVLAVDKYQIENATTVDAVEVVHGKWEMGLDEGDYEYGTCSVCGYNEYNAFGCLLPHNYCPNCGAKMDGGNEDG